MNYKLLAIMNEQYQHILDSSPEELESDNTSYSVNVDSSDNEECEMYIPCQADIDLLNYKF